MTQTTLAKLIVDAVSGVVGEGAAALREPYFGGNEWQYVKECLDSTFVSSVGKFVDQFEEAVTEYTKADHAIAVSCGTSALHVALKLAGVRAGDEVLVPTLTFVATSNSVAYCDAVPHFVDSEEDTFGIDASALRQYLAASTEMRGGNCVNLSTGRVIRAIVPVHIFGHPVDVVGVLGVAKDFNLSVVEDGAGSIGSTYNGRHVGTFGDLGVFSFNGNKTITTGGGGAIVTNDPELARRAKHLTTTAKVSHRWEYRHDELGYNYRLPNLNAALGCAQFEQLPRLLKANRYLYQLYAQAFESVPGVRIFSEKGDCQSNYWLQALLLDDDIADERDNVLAATNDAGLTTRPIWVLNHRLPMFHDSPRMHLATAEKLERRVINLPSSAHLAWGEALR